MKIKKIFSLIKTLSAIAFLINSQSYAFDLSILKNDKEAVTHAYGSRDLRRAQDYFNTVGNEMPTQRAFLLLGESINELEKSGRICDLSLLKIFISKLDSSKIPSDYDSLNNLMIIWRDQNLIDDLFFEIMVQSISLNDSLIDFSTDFGNSNEIYRSENLLEFKKIKPEDLTYIYKGINSYTIKNPGCSVDEWFNISRSLSLTTQKQKNIRSFNVAANSKKALNDEAFLLAEAFRVNDVQNWNITLKKYLSIISELKNKSRVTPITSSDYKTNSLSSKYRDKNSTYRQSLYYHYNSLQIGLISDVMKKTIERMDATKAELVFTYGTKQEILPISPMGQYNIARNLLRKDLLDLSRSTFFGGATITHEDLITASLETGILNSDMLDSALKIDDLWNPEVKQWKKISDFAFRVTGTATLFLPPPYNVITSIALVFIDGIIAKKTTKPTSGDNIYDFF